MGGILAIIRILMNNFCHLSDTFVKNSLGIFCKFEWLFFGKMDDHIASKPFIYNTLVLLTFTHVTVYILTVEVFY